MRKVSHSDVISLALSAAMPNSSVIATGGPEEERKRALLVAQSTLDKLNADPALLISDVHALSHEIGSGDDNVTGLKIGPDRDAGFQTTLNVVDIRYATRQDFPDAPERPLEVIRDPGRWGSIANKRQPGTPSYVFWNRGTHDDGTTRVHLWRFPPVGAIVNLYVYEAELTDLREGAESWLPSGDMDLLVSTLACDLCAHVGTQAVPAALLRRQHRAEAAVRRGRSQRAAYNAATAVGIAGVGHRATYRRNYIFGGR